MNKKALIIIIGIVVLFGIAASMSSDSSKTTPQTAVTPTSVVANKKATPTPTSRPTESIATLTHDQLLAVSKKNYEESLNKPYNMTLYLNQAPTTTQADFMTQSDTNDENTILIVCNMNSNDLDKLDGVSAQKGIYKPYEMQVLLTKYNASIGLTYEATCLLR